MLFFEYYTKYNSSPTEHQVFTSPPIERSIYFVHHHVLPLSVFIFQEHSSVSELMLQGSPRPLRCSRTLARPRSCSGTLARPRSCSGTRQTTPCSGFYNNSKSNSLSCRSPRRISKTTPCLHEMTRSDLKPKYQNHSTSWTTTPSPSPNTASTRNFQVKVSSIKMFLLLRANRKQAGPMHIWIYACIVYGYMQVNVMPMQGNKEPPYYV